VDITKHYHRIITMSKHNQPLSFHCANSHKIIGREPQPFTFCLTGQFETTKYAMFS